MNLTARDRYLPYPAAGLAVLSVVNPDPTSLCRETMMTRMSAAQFALLTSARQDEQGMPLAWAPTDDGRAQVWPVPDRDYILRGRDVLGRDVDAVRKPAEMVPVMEMAAALNRQHEEQMTRNQVEVEDFRRGGRGAME